MSTSSTYNTVSELLAHVPVDSFILKKAPKLDTWHTIERLLKEAADSAFSVEIELTLETKASTATFRRKIRITSVAFRDGNLEFTGIFVGCHVAGDWNERRKHGEFSLS